MQFIELGFWTLSSGGLRGGTERAVPVQSAEEKMVLSPISTAGLNHVGTEKPERGTEKSHQGMNPLTRQQILFRKDRLGVLDILFPICPVHTYAPQPPSQAEHDTPNTAAPHEVQDSGSRGWFSNSTFHFGSQLLPIKLDTDFREHSVQQQHAWQKILRVSILGGLEEVVVVVFGGGGFNVRQLK